MDSLGAWALGLLVTLALGVVLMAAYALKWRMSAGVVVFSVLCLCVAIYSFAYGMELTSDSLPQALLWNRIQYVTLPFLAPLWLMLALYYRSRERVEDRFVWFAMFAIPVTTLVLRWTPSLVHLHYASVQYTRLGGLFLLQIGRGPWFLVHSVHSTILTAYSVYLYAGVLHSGEAPAQQSRLLLVGSVAPIIGLWLNVSGIVPYGFDVGPLALSVTALLLYVALFRFRYLDVVPLALEKVFEWSKDPILIVTAEGTIAQSNPAALSVLGELAHKSTGRAIRELLGTHTKLAEAIESKQDADVEIVVGGNLRHYRAGVTPINARFGQIIGYMVTLSDVTSQVLAYRQLEIVASTDALTGVSNRKHALDRILSSVRESKACGLSFSILMIDVDLFKQVNDRYGHQAGDAVLRHVAEVCSQSIRAVDILGRYGGEEFVVGLPGASREAAVIIAERLRFAVSQRPTTYDTDQIPVTVSVGVAELPPEAGISEDQILRLADRALYAAKSAGRNRVELADLPPALAQSV